VEELDLFQEQAVGVPLLMRIWVEFTTNDYVGAPQPDVHFEGLHRLTAALSLVPCYPNRQRITNSH